MIEIKLTDKNHAMQKLAESMSARNLTVANVRAINVAIQKASTQYRKLITGQYNLKYADTKQFSISKRATYGHTEGSISAPTAPISLFKFNPTFYNTNKGTVSSVKKRKGVVGKTDRAETANDVSKGVAFQIKKGDNKNLPFAFLIDSEKNAGFSMQVWARGEYKGNKFSIGKSRKPIAPIKTVSPIGTMNNPVVSKATDIDARRNMQKEFERQVELLLSKIER